MSDAVQTKTRCRPSRQMPLTPLTMTVQAASQASGLGMTKLYQKIRDGTLRSVLIDGRRLVFYDSLKAMLTPD